MQPNPVKREARCCCGGGHIVVSGEPETNVVCHCSDCKRRTGSAFGWSAYFKDEQIVESTGAFHTYQITDRQQRSFAGSAGRRCSGGQSTSKA